MSVPMTIFMSALCVIIGGGQGDILSDRIADQEFNAVTTERIKKIKGLSHCKEDLETLKRFKLLITK